MGERGDVEALASVFVFFLLNLDSLSPNTETHTQKATMPTASRSRCTPSCSRWASG